MSVSLSVLRSKELNNLLVFFKFTKKLHLDERRKVYISHTNLKYLTKYNNILKCFFNKKNSPGLRTFYDLSGSRKKDKTKIKETKLLEEKNTKEKVKSCSDGIKDGNSFNRPQRRLYSDEVVWGFIPKAWVDAFIPKTGYSGFYTFLTTFATYLFSKEIYVCDHEYYNGISLAIFCVMLVRTFKVPMAQRLDAEIEAYLQEMNNGKEEHKKVLTTNIEQELESQKVAETELLLVAARRFNVLAQREGEFRRRKMFVYDETLRILKYHMKIAELEIKFRHRNLIEWVTKEVEKALTPEEKEKYLKLCLDNIEEYINKAK